LYASDAVKTPRILAISAKDEIVEPSLKTNGRLEESALISTSSENDAGSSATHPSAIGQNGGLLSASRTQQQPRKVHAIDTVDLRNQNMGFPVPRSACHCVGKLVDWCGSPSMSIAERRSMAD